MSQVGVFLGLGVRGRAFLESFFWGKDGIDELKVHGLDDVDDRDVDVCFILIFIFICGKKYCGNLFYPDLIAKQK